MVNQVMDWAVHAAIYRDVHWAFHRAMDPTAYGAVYRWFVIEAVVEDVYGVLDEAGAQPEEPPHPGLAIYLGGVG